jgi:carboxypeptidase family protein
MSGVFIATVLTLAALGGPAGQLQSGSIIAVVLDERDRPVVDAVLRLTDALGAELQRATSDSQGRATFAGVVPGRYRVSMAAPGLASFDVPAQVTGALPIEITVRVPSAVTSHVVVQGAAADPSTRDSLAAETLAQVPIRSRARGLQEAVATLPGWATEDNGLLHARGVDDGFLYVIDGVPVYERLDAVSGIAPDLS